MYIVSTPDGYNAPKEGLLQSVSIVFGDPYFLGQVELNDLLADPRVLVECWVRKGDWALGLSHLTVKFC